MKIISLLLIINLILSGCSSLLKTNHFTRLPANTLVDVNEAVSFRKTTKSNKVDLSDVIKNQIQSSFSNISFKPDFIETSSLSSDIAFKIEFDIVDGKYLVRILHSPDAFMYHQAAIELYGFIYNFTLNQTLINSPFDIFEIYYNAKEKDVESIDNLLKLRNNVIGISNINILDKPSNEIVDDIKAEVAELRSEIASEVKAAQKNRKSQKELRKNAIELLDKASSDSQFKALVAKNDRKAVAELLKKYLPYEDMAPFERRFWDTYLEVIKHPLPLEQRVIIYRGIDDDVIHQAVINGEELTKTEAIQESKAFFMSTVLVKNQGSWNRRLRSLESMENKFIGTINGSDEFSRSARITTMFKNHSIKAEGSPFLSFTPDLGIAIRFGRVKNSAYLMDPRLLQFNYTSGYVAEKEFLVPLVTFPDELIGIWTAETSPDKLAAAYFTQRLEDLVTSKFGKANKDKILNQIYKNTKDYFSPITTLEDKTTTKITNTGILDYFKKFVKNKSEPAIITDGEGNINCEALLKTFWIHK